MDTNFSAFLDFGTKSMVQRHFEMILHLHHLHRGMPDLKSPQATSIFEEMERLCIQMSQVFHLARLLHQKLECSRKVYLFPPALSLSPNFVFQCLHRVFTTLRSLEKQKHPIKTQNRNAKCTFHTVLLLTDYKERSDRCREAYRLNYKTHTHLHCSL